jgi:hypothetical protein
MLVGNEARDSWQAERRQAFAIAADHAHGRPTQEFVTNESQVVAAFSAWLTKQGWRIRTEVGFVDVVATRGRRRIIAEARGGTADASLDADTAYGQLLRRMGPDGAGLDTRYAIVAPESSRTAVLRVPAPIRQRLNIDVYLVSVDGGVEKVDE